MQPNAVSLTAFLQIFGETCAVALSERNANPQLFEILLQGFPSEIDFPRVAELPDVSFELGFAETSDAAAHAPESLLGKPPIQHVPIGLHEAPTQFTAIHVVHDRADHEGCILNTNLTAEGLGQCLVEQGRLPELRQGKEIAAFFLRRSSRFESLGELVVTSRISGKGKDSHEGRKKIRIDRR